MSGISERAGRDMAPSLHILIVEARFYPQISDELLRGATAALSAAGATFDRVEVPGVFEIPAAIRMAVAASPARALFHALAEQQEMEAAFATLDGALEDRPDDGDLLLFAAAMYADYDDPDTAEELLARAEGKVPGPARLREAARVKALRVDLPAVIGLWRAVLDAEPLAPDAHRGLAQALADWEGRAAVLDHLRTACERFPHSYPLHQQWLDWLRGDDAAQAEAVARHLLELCPGDAWAHRELALHLTAQSRFDEVAKGLADMECGASTVTLGRMKEVDFSNYVFVESTGVAVLGATLASVCVRVVIGSLLAPVGSV